MKHIAQLMIMIFLLNGCSRSISFIDNTTSEPKRLNNLYPQGQLLVQPKNARLVSFMLVKEIKKEDFFAYKSVKIVNKNFPDKILGVSIYEVFEDVNLSSGTARCLKYDFVFEDYQNKTITSFRQHATC